MSITKEINNMGDEELREFALQIARENRRLRQILDGMARTETGKGALVELYADRDEHRATMGVVVCRADVDEVAFMASIREGLNALFEAAELTPNHAEARREGVTSLDGAQP